MTGVGLDNLRFSLAFSMLKNININIADALLARIGSIENLFSMSAEELKAIGRFPEYIHSENTRKELLEKASKEEDFILQNDISVLYYKSSCYPSRLLNCSDGPVLLYQLGHTNLEARHIISIVGTRRATPYGIEMTNRIVRDLAERLDDLVIVSGLAYGIDVAAHRAAMDCGLRTVAVMANPLNTIYPADHRSVAVKILKTGGSLLTEYSTSHEVHKINFLARNRIIAGISDVTIVVESDQRGGSLVTAGLAMDYGREVFAVPGRLTDKYSRGALELISANRAHIYTDANDMISELGWESIPGEGEQMTLAMELNPVEQKICEFLTSHPASRVNEIMIGTEIPKGQLMDSLFNLEIKDIIVSLAGGKYSVL